MYWKPCKKAYNLFIVLLVVTAIINSFYKVSYAATNVIDEANQIIKTNTINDASDNSSNTSSIQDMVKSLNDPYAEYIPTEQYKNYMDNLNDRYVGIGAYISPVPEGVSIVSLMDDSPALTAGLKVGDIITIADGQILSGLPLGTASSYIKGEEGTVVKLHVKRGRSFFNCDIIRKKVAISTVDANILDEHIGYFKITSFTESTLNDFKKKLKKVKTENPDNYIIDLRENGGGLLSSAIGVAGSFIDGLKPVVVVKDRSNEKIEHISFGSTQIIDKPVIFLVNKNTASAAEVLTAAVKDYRKAMIIGTNTYGKGTVQGIFALSDGSAVKMTIQSFYSPKGFPIDKTGIQPDIDVKDADALTAARLILSKSSGNDKVGFIKYRVDDREFEIDLKSSSNYNNWRQFVALIESAVKKGNELYLGTKSGWDKVGEDVLKEPQTLFYRDYSVMEGLINVPTDKVFTIKFNSEIDRTSINEKSFELVNTRSGDRILIKTEFLDQYRIKIIPQETLSIGQIYYLIIHNTIMSKSGSSLKQGTVTKVTVSR